jgi:hypothetical protein
MVACLEEAVSQREAMTGSGRKSFDACGSRWRAAYFALQGLATLAWWLLIAVSPTWRRWFAFADDGASLLQFLPGDLIFWVLGSFLAAWAELIGASWQRGVRHAVGGAVACSLVHAMSVAALAGAGFRGVILMTPAVLLTGWLSWFSDR